MGPAANLPSFMGWEVLLFVADQSIADLRLHLCFWAVLPHCRTMIT